MKGAWKCVGTLETGLRSRGFVSIAGADEVGRGSLFGAVVAAAVILDPCRSIRGLNDSKQIEPERREELAALIRERALAWAVGAVDADVIDRVNIYQASRIAMKMAVESLGRQIDYVLVDAVRLDLPCPQLPLIQGDERCHSIAAASIVAKVYRDTTMKDWDQVYPEFGLSRHKGYNTPEHVRALQQHGPSPLHRMSFAPVQASARKRAREFGA
jgi:ribonuclease HII